MSISRVLMSHIFKSSNVPTFKFIWTTIISTCISRTMPEWSLAHKIGTVKYQGLLDTLAQCQHCHVSSAILGWLLFCQFCAPALLKCYPASSLPPMSPCIEQASMLILMLMSRSDIQMFKLKLKSKSSRSVATRKVTSLQIIISPSIESGTSATFKYT